MTGRARWQRVEAEHRVLVRGRTVTTALALVAVVARMSRCPRGSIAAFEDRYR